MNDETPQSETNTASGKKERNPTEKMIVRTVIVAMIVLVVVEAHARLGYSNSLSSLQKRLELDDEGEPLNIDNVPNFITGFPSRKETGESSFTYRWTSFVKSYGIKISHDNENHVISLITDLPPEIPEPTPPSNAESEDTGMGGMGMAEPSADGESTERPRGPRERRRPAEGETPSETAPEGSPATEASTEEKPTTTEKEPAPATERPQRPE